MTGRAALRALAVAALALALISAAVTGAVLALFTPVTFDELGFHPVALDYVDGRIGRLEMTQTVIDGQTFGMAEIDHLDDVAALLGLMSWLFAGTAVVFVAAMVVAPRLARSGALTALAGLAVAGGATFAAYAVFGFEPVGVVFHEVLFPQGNWRFPWYFLMIRLYGTNEMLTGAAFVIAAGVAIVLAAVAATALIARRRRAGQAQTQNA